MQQPIYFGKEALTVLVMITFHFLLYLDGDVGFAKVLFKIRLPEFYTERLEEQFDGIFKRSVDDVRK